MDLLLEEESGMPAMADADEPCVPSASLLSCTSLPSFASIRQASGVVDGGGGLIQRHRRGPPASTSS